MSYNFELAMSTVVSADVVEQMVKTIVEKQTGKTVSNIHYRYDGTKFDGFDIMFSSETYNKTNSSGPVDKTFKPMKWD